MRSVTYWIRLQEEEDSGRKKNQTRRKISMSVKGHLLNGLQKKLNPSPIVPLTTSVKGNRGYRIDSHRILIQKSIAKKEQLEKLVKQYWKGIQMGL